MVFPILTFFPEQIIASKAIVGLWCFPKQFDFLIGSDFEIQVARRVARTCGGALLVGIFTTIATFAKHANAIAVTALLDGLVQ